MSLFDLADWLRGRGDDQRVPAGCCYSQRRGDEPRRVVVGQERVNRGPEPGQCLLQTDGFPGLSGSLLSGVLSYTMAADTLRGVQVSLCRTLPGSRLSSRRHQIHLEAERLCVRSLRGRERDDHRPGERRPAAGRETPPAAGLSLHTDGEC